LYYTLIYYGSYAVIGASSHGGRFYSSFIDRYLDYPSWLRSSLLRGSSIILDGLGYETRIESPYKVRIKGGAGVKIVYSCLGIGLISFWIAFILANKSSAGNKTLYILFGITAIIIINMLRIVLLVLSANGHWKWLVNADHHTVFNVVSYLLIFVMMLFFDRNERRQLQVK